MAKNKNTKDTGYIRNIYTAYCKCGKYAASSLYHYEIDRMAIDHAEICGHNVVIRRNDSAINWVCPDEREYRRKKKEEYEQARYVCIQRVGSFTQIVRF